MPENASIFDADFGFIKSVMDSLLKTDCHTYLRVCILHLYFHRINSLQNDISFTFYVVYLGIYDYPTFFISPIVE